MTADINIAAADSKRLSKKRKRRIAAWSLAAILTLSLAAPFLGALLPSGATPAAAEESAEVNPRSEYWREVRGGNVGYSAVDGDEAGSLVNSGGQNWRRIRNGWVANFMPLLIVAVLIALCAYHALRGQNKIAEPLSGRKVLRWKTYERALHFAMAGLFIVLAITGLSLLLGRALLIPILGKDAFAAYAVFAKDLHNYLGPPFMALLLAVVVLWARHNIFNAVDAQWLKRWGGLFGGGEHPHAGRMNGGEKIWFWIVAVVGGAVCVSGLVLDFPNFDQSRAAMQAAHLFHATLGVGWIAVALGHIYIGTLGTEGALEGMATGYVSEEWARQHHDLWLEDIQKEGGENASAESSSGAAEEKQA